MSKMKKIDLRSLTAEPFNFFDREWPLLTVADGEGCNPMTVSWGQVGTLWNRSVCTLFVRPQRYTYGLLEREECFTVSFLDSSYKKELTLCGTKSGRDIDKLAACGFTAARADCGAPYIAQAKRVLVCRKLYEQDLEKNCFLDPTIAEQCYARGDFSRVFIAEVIEVLEAEE